MKSHVLKAVSAIVLAGTVLGTTALSALAAIPGPTNLTIDGGKYTNDTTPTFTWVRPNGATWYEVLLDNGSWLGVGNVGHYTLWPVVDGWHTFYVRAHDNTGGVSSSVSLTFEVDTVGPTVPQVKNVSTSTGVATTIEVTPRGEAAVTACWLYVDGENVGSMTKHGGTWTRSYTFPKAGDVLVRARCADGDGNYTLGDVRTITVRQGAISYGDDGLTGIPYKSLVKTSCGSYVPASDRCHAVYYVDAGGVRHLFTSESVYKSWFGSSFDDVKTISTWQMDHLKLGENVTMRPGTQLVKFSGSSTVYAVDNVKTLRPIVSEAVARAIYGVNWQSEVRYFPASEKANYTMGAKIYSTSDYSRVEALRGAKSIDTLWIVAE